MSQPGAKSGAPAQSCGPSGASAPPYARKTWLLGALAVLILGGCAVGPDFKSPDAPAAATGTTASDAYTPTPTPATTQSAPVVAGEAQHLLTAQDIPAQWWTLFRSDSLDQLLKAALAQNPNLAAAQASLRSAQESLRSEKGALLYPNVGLGASVQRERQPLVTSALDEIPYDYTTYNITPTVSYQLDVFGGNRRTLESLQAAVDYQRFQVEGVYLTLAANLVTTAIREASLRGQLQATLDVLALEEQALKVVNVQFNAGAVSKASVLTQQTQVAQTRATLPALENSLAQARHQLAVYAGRLPSEMGLPEFQLDSLHLPQELPVSLPSALVRQRPDVRASEALLHEASAQVGVATAAQYPQFNLTGYYGTATSHTSDLFDPASIIWSITGGITQPIFNGGALSAKKRAAQAAFDQSQQQYKATVLTAFQNVADSLRAIEFDAAALRTQAEAESLARQSLDLSNNQYKLGAVSFLQLLDAQRTYQQTRISVVQAQAARFADTAALFQSLGGGWWNEGPLADASRPGTDATTQRPTLDTVPPAQ